jgi:GntR family galactonate operon transcriptional repressor
VRTGGKLCSAVTADLGRQIVSGGFAPGQPLPTENALCDRFGVSRTTVREAVMRLHGKGLLDGGPRTGLKVLPVSRWNQLDGDVLRWRAASGMDREFADQLYEVRGCIEPQACRLAAERASADDLRQIRATFEALSCDSGDVAAHVEADVAFHLAIFAATHNPILISLGGSIRTGLELAFRQSQQRRRMSAAEMALHSRIATAIAERQGEVAAAAMTRLLKESRLALT